MVTFITILRVNVVMSILLCMVFLGYICGNHSLPTKEQKTLSDPLASFIFKLLQADIGKRKSRNSTDSEEKWQNTLSQSMPHLPKKLHYLGWSQVDNDWELFQHKSYNSARVLLSEWPPLQPPPLYLMDDYMGILDTANKNRKKHFAKHKSYQAEYSVCDSESQWVTDKTNAVDIRGRQVTVLGMIKTGGLDVKQYFYEPKCREARPIQDGCRGINDKRWNSQCKTSQTYVLALTSDQTSVGWRWIRIDTSCMCALSHKKHWT